MRDHFEDTLDWFRRVALGHAEVSVEPSAGWTDDAWYLDQDDRTAHPDEGWWPLQPGAAAGRVVGTNLCTLNLLQGTGSMPSLDGSLLVLEDGGRARIEVPADGEPRRGSFVVAVR